MAVISRRREVSRVASKSGPIFGNLYTMAHWMFTQERERERKREKELVRKGIPPRPSSTLPLRRDEIVGRVPTAARTERMEKDGSKKGRTAQGRLAGVYF